MRYRLAIAFAVATVVGLATGCPPTLEECRSTFDVRELCTKEEFEKEYVIPPPPPGPKIILKKDGTGAYQTYVDYGAGEILQSAGPSVCTSNTIRSDFVLDRIESFTIHAGGTTYPDRNYIRFWKTTGGDRCTVELLRVAGDRARWRAKKNNGAWVVLTETPYAGDNKVPDEFSAFDPQSFVDVVDELTIDKIDFLRVETVEN